MRSCYCSTMSCLWQEIGIDAQHVCETQAPGRFQLICDKKWLQTLERQQRIDVFPIWQQLDRRAHPAGILQHPWTRILVQTYEKQVQTKVYPLPHNNRISLNNNNNHITNDLDFLPLCYSQAIAYVANENFKKLWSAAYKQYQTAHVKHNKLHKLTQSPEGSNMPTLSYNAALRELIQQLWHCQLIDCATKEANVNNLMNYTENEDCHVNLPAAIAAIETTTHICVFFFPPAVVTSIYDCITYSPAVLSKNYNKALFLIYQILQLAKSFQATGLFLGDVRLHDFLMRDNLWLQLVPKLNTNLLLIQNANQQQPQVVAGNEDDDILILEYEQGEDNSCSFDLKFAYDVQQFTLREYCEMWCNNQLSNFDYLTILNNASGRSLNNPA